MPAPRDYNVLLRVLQVKPDLDTAAQVEIDALTTCMREDRVRLYALYIQSLSTLATTITYDFNLSAQIMWEWGQGNGDIPAPARQVVQMYSQANPHALTEPAIMTQIKTLFPVFLGCSEPYQLYPGSDWLGLFGASPACAIAFIGQPPQVPLRRGSPLCVDNWFLTRPMEWGISGSNTTLDIRKELMDVGAPLNRGWRAVRGSEVYTERAALACPIKVVIYGVQVLNAINNDFRWPAEHPPQFSQAFWSPGGGVEWNPPVQMVQLAPVFNEDLHTYEPCTLMSYNYQDQTVLAPSYTGVAALGGADLRRLSNWSGQLQPRVGFNVSSPLESTPLTTFSHQMNLSSMFGHLSVASVPEGEAQSLSALNPT